MSRCPHCDEMLDLSNDSRGTRSGYTGAEITMVEQGQDINMTAHCRNCDKRLNIWASVDSVS